MTGALSEQEFRVQSDDALESVRRVLMPLADAEDFDVEFENGVLDIRFESPSAARFIVSPNAPARQVWVSALGHGYKLSWSAQAGVFAYDGEPLVSLVERLVHLHLGH